MRIAYLCADRGVPVFGRKGASVHVQGLVGALAGRGAAVELFATRVGGPAPPGLEGVRLHRLPPVRDGEPAERERSALAANDGMRRALRREGPFDLVYERYSLWSFAGMEHARKAGVPGVLEVNAPLIDEHAAHRRLHDRAAAERASARAFGSAELLVAVSEEVAGYLRGQPAVASRVEVVANGVDPVRFAHYDAGSGEGIRPFTVGFVGTLKPWHGLGTLVEGFARLRERDRSARLLIVGDGPERQRVEAELATLGVARGARFTGAVDPGRVPRFLRSMDVAVAPYPDLRPFYFSPLKVYEYMAAGRAVVASRVGQLAELVDDGVTGLLCAPGDPAALAEALWRLRNDVELRLRLGRAARASVLRRHTWDAVAERILRLAEADRQHAEVA